MAATLKELLALPPDERARLATELIRSLDAEADPTAAEAWDAEIERRATEVESGSTATITLDEYRAHVSARRAARARR